MEIKDDITIFLDPPEILVDVNKRRHHPKLGQHHLSISCNVTADPAPDVNWQRGRHVLSTHDTKVSQVFPSYIYNPCIHCRTSTG